MGRDHLACWSLHLDLSHGGRCLQNTLPSPLGTSKKVTRPVILVNKLDISPKQTHFWVPCAEKITSMVLIGHNVAGSSCGSYLGLREWV